MKWRHEVSADWLEARKMVVTATDIIYLFNDYQKTVKAGGLGDKVPPAFASLWMKKMSDESVDTVSYNEAAAGHIKEPYAVLDYNAQRRPEEVELFCWNDCLITNGQAGFSPDVLDVPQYVTEVSIDSQEFGTHCLAAYGHKPTHGMEIKSYGPEKYGKRIAANEIDWKERMQIAMAMFVLQSLEVMALCFYCPAAPEDYRMDIRNAFTRADLVDDIAVIYGIMDMWQQCCAMMASIQGLSKGRYSEQDIYDEWVVKNTDAFIV